MNRLPRELVSLVHNIELNRVGWWDKAIQSSISASMSIVGSPLSIGDIARNIKQLLGVEISQTSLRSNIEALHNSGIIIELEQNLFKMAECTLESLSKRQQEFDALNTRLEKRFTVCLADLGVHNGAELWQPFNTECLFPLICDEGARAYYFLTGSDRSWDKYDLVDSFVARYGPDNDLAIRKGIITFLDPNEPDIRQYILDNLRAAFVIKSANLDASEIALLTARMGTRPRLTVFVDTNFLFSVLGLHDNPLNESARYLIDLASKLTSNVEVKFYVLPITLKEMQNALASMQAITGDIRLTASMSTAVISQDLHSLPGSYVEAARSASVPVYLRDYLDPYIKNPLPILRQWGLEIYNDSQIDAYGTKQSVVDDISQQLKREQEKYGPDAKTYEKLAHDMILWHYVNDKRPVTVGSPLEACYWVVTVDNRLVSFDSYKTRVKGSGLVACMTPSAMISMLQFWAPRTEELDQAVVSSLRPFFCRPRDNEVEKISVAILKTLSRYEDVSDLSEETIVNILTNDALRQRMESGCSDEVQSQLIRDALIQEHHRTTEELSRVRKELDDSNIAIEQYRRNSADRDRALQDKDDQIRNLSEKLEVICDELASAQWENEGLSEAMDVLRKDFEAHRSSTARDSRGMYTLVSLSMLVVFLLIALQVAAWIPGTKSIPLWKTRILSALLTSVVWVLIVDKMGSQNDAVSNWKPFKSLHRVKGWAIGIMTTLIASVLYDFVRGFFK